MTGKEAATRTVDELADVRTGDKGSTLILAVVPRGSVEYAYLEKRLTESAVARHFEALSVVDVRRTCLPQLPGMVFEMSGALGGGVTGAPWLDGHGKCLSYHLLTLRL